MKLPKYIVLEKKVGETPLEVLDEFKRKHKEYAAVPMAYAGRLDPLASGKLLVLVGHECKKQEKYQGLDKEYVIEIALGVSSDTGDPLGLVSAERACDMTDVEYLMDYPHDIIGRHRWHYPAFSSKTVDGKPLFQYALAGELDQIEIPTKEIQVYEIEALAHRSISREAYVQEAIAKVDSIKPVTEHQKALGNDFRRDAIRKRYEEVEKELPETIHIVSIRCVCSSGTYMRTLAEKLADEFCNTSGLAHSIHRTKIGRFKTIGPLKLWLKKY